MRSYDFIVLSSLEGFFFFVVFARRFSERSTVVGIIYLAVDFTMELAGSGNRFHGTRDSLSQAMN
jgi:hypothetical protein